MCQGLQRYFIIKKSLEGIAHINYYLNAIELSKLKEQKLNLCSKLRAKPDKDDNDISLSLSVGCNVILSVALRNVESVIL